MYTLSTLEGLHNDIVEVQTRPSRDVAPTTTSAPASGTATSAQVRVQRPSVPAAATQTQASPVPTHVQVCGGASAPAVLVILGLIGGLFYIATKTHS